MMSEEKIRISQSFKEAVAEDYLSYREKERLMGVFTRIKKQVSKEEPAYHLKDDMAVNARENLSEAMNDYVDIIDSNLQMKIRDAVVDAERLTEVERKTTEYLRQRIHKPLLLSLFKQTIEIKEDVKLNEGMGSINIDKESFAEGIEPLSILNEGDIQAGAVVESIQRMVFRKLLQAEAHKKIVADDFNMLITEIVSSPDLAEKNVLVLSKEVCNQYYHQFIQTIALRENIKSNADGSKSITTDFGTTNIYFMPYFDQSFSLAVDEDFFSVLSLRQYESGNLVEAVAEDVRSDSERFNLILKYEMNAVLKGDVSVRIEHPETAEGR